MNVYQKLQAARLKLQNSELKKSGHNKFAGYQYFELGDFLPKTQEIFQEVGLCGTVAFTPELAILSIVNMDKPDEQITITSPMGSAALKGCHEVQNIGAVETYQRRYLWGTAMEIVEHDALDATTGDKEPAKPAKKTITPTDGALDALTSTERKRAEKLAIHISSSFAAGEDWSGFEAWESDTSENEFKIAVWSLLASNVRSKIKLMKAEAEKPAVTA